MNAERDIDEICDFISNQKLDPSLFTKDAQCVASYGKFYAILLLRHGTSKIALLDANRTFIDELASDASYSLYFTIIGAYKPARLSLRGAIENCLRAILIFKAVEIDSKPIHRLFSDVEGLGELVGCKSLLDDVKNQYTLLCKTSHTIDIKFMANKIPFAELLSHESEEFTSNLQIFDKTIASVLGLLHVFFKEAVFKLDAQGQDFVLKRLSKKVKRAVLNS